MTSSELESFMPNGGFFSRDYAITIRCENKKCYLQSNGACVSPSVVLEKGIDSTGKCAHYEEYRIRNKDW